VERTRESAAQLGSAAPASSLFTLVGASVSASYTLDVFGGIRRQVEQLQAQADYERYLLEAAYLTLTANVVTAAVNEASLRAQIAATREIIAAERQELDLVTSQLALGGVSRADVLQQQATLAATEATLPALSGQLAQARNQLAVYLGRTPNLYDAAPFELAKLHLPEELPLSLPSALVNQRPDIQEYAALLHAATANVGIATANMLPQITLSASVGADALSVGRLFTPGSEIFSLGSALTQPLFEGGALLHKRRAAVAALDQALAQYRSTVITAFQNVANALVALQTDAETLRADLVASQTASDSLALVRRQLSEGGTTYLAVLTAEQTDQNARINLVRAQAARFTDTAALFQALGGGWWNRSDVEPKIADCCKLP
jgi:NodT family efflux transporter outer membrane factor (OMF) lipoprotein